MEEKNSLKDYVWNTGNAFEIMRLLVEGAITLYEEDALSLQSLARDNQQPEAATAFDTIGTALYNLREHLRKLQAIQVAVTESKVSER